MKSHPESWQQIAATLSLQNKPDRPKGNLSTFASSPSSHCRIIFMLVMNEIPMAIHSRKLNQLCEDACDFQQHAKRNLLVLTSCWSSAVPRFLLRRNSRVGSVAASAIRLRIMCEYVANQLKFIKCSAPPTSFFTKSLSNYVPKIEHLQIRKANQPLDQPATLPTHDSPASFSPLPTITTHTYAQLLSSSNHPSFTPSLPRRPLLLPNAPSLATHTTLLFPLSQSHGPPNHTFPITPLPITRPLHTISADEGACV